MKKNNLLKYAGYTIIIFIWVNYLWQAIANDLVAMTLGLIIIPFVTIPLSLIGGLFNSFWFGVLDILLFALGIYLAIKYTDKKGTMIKTTKKHFKLFKSEVIRLVNLFGLTDWKISFEHKDLEDDYVRLSWDYSGSVACFFLCTNWDIEE